MYLRLLTSAEIKTNPEIAAFLIHPETGEQMDPESFCNNFVEAVGKEAGESRSRARGCTLSFGRAGAASPFLLSALRPWWRVSSQLARTRCEQGQGQGEAVVRGVGFDPNLVTNAVRQRRGSQRARVTSAV